MHLGALERSSLRTGSAAFIVEEQGGLHRNVIPLWLMSKHLLKAILALRLVHVRMRSRYVKRGGRKGSKQSKG